MSKWCGSVKIFNFCLEPISIIRFLSYLVWAYQQWDIYSELSVRKLGFCDKPREILLHSDSDIRFPRLCCQRSGYDSAPSRLEGRVYQTFVLQHDSKIRSLSARVIPADWEANSIDTGNLPSATTLPSPPARQTSSSSQRETLRRSCCLVIGSQRGASVVASPTECLEWQCDFEPFPRTLHRNGCFEDGLGCCTPGDNNRGPLQ